MNKMTCQRCKHSWLPRTENPIECPKCKSYNWKELKCEMKCISESTESPKNSGKK